MKSKRKSENMLLINRSNLLSKRDKILNCVGEEVLYIDLRTKDWFIESAENYLKLLIVRTNFLMNCSKVGTSIFDYLIELKGGLEAAENNIEAFVDHFHDELVWYSEIKEINRKLKIRLSRFTNYYQCMSPRKHLEEEHLKRLLTDATKESMGNPETSRTVIRVINTLISIDFMSSLDDIMDKRLVESINNSGNIPLNILLSDETLEAINCSIGLVHIPSTERYMSETMAAASELNKLIKSWEKMMKEEIVNFSKKEGLI